MIPEEPPFWYTSRSMAPMLSLLLLARASMKPLLKASLHAQKPCQLHRFPPSETRLWNFPQVGWEALSVTHFCHGPQLLVSICAAPQSAFEALMTQSIQNDSVQTAELA